MADNNELDPRADSIIYSRLNPLSDEVKTKINNAFLDVVTRFKDRHLS